MTRIYSVENPPEKPKKDPRPHRYAVTFLERDWGLIERAQAVAKTERRSLRNLIIVALEEWLEGRKGNEILHGNSS